MPVLVLLRVFAPDPLPPEARAIGRAALTLEREGLPVLFGTAQGAWRAIPGGWIPADPHSATAIFDRYPSWTWPEAYRAALRGLEHLPLANPPAVAALCRDKVAAQAHLDGLPMPELEVDPTRFEARLADWGVGFHKPRFGALGRGVRRVTPGDALFAEGPGATRGTIEPYFLQRAVAPPAPWAGLSLRLLVQRESTGAWWVGPPVARVSATDPVANVDRGAEARDARALLSASTLERACALAVAAAQRMDGAIELGVDLVPDADGAPWIIELNNRPGGRLAELARQHPDRFGPLADEACARPLRTLAGA